MQGNDFKILRDRRNKMTYKPEKDVLIKTLLDNGEDGITVEIRQYNNGEKKIQLTRKYNGEFRKLGRLTLDEGAEISRAISAYVDEK